MNQSMEGRVEGGIGGSKITQFKKWQFIKLIIGVRQIIQACIACNILILLALSPASQMSQKTLTMVTPKHRAKRNSQ